MNMAREAFDVRFWRQVDRDPQQWTCWLWTGGTTPFGYGLARRSDGSQWRGVVAHRVAWELMRGPIPHDMQVLHRCDEPSCVNPIHLFLGTQRDNVRDMLMKGRSSRRRERCKRGHVLAETGRWLSATKRLCAVCQAVRRRAWRRTHRDSHLR